MAAAHPEGPPLVVDPFAGIGSIPFEALRIGADAFAADLNPVAVLLNKVALEYLPTYGLRLAEAVRRWGQWVRERAIEELRPFYPLEPDGSEPLAYLWARTIRCEGPGCGAEVPLDGLLWLSRKEKQRVALRYKASGGGGTGVVGTGVPPVRLSSSPPGLTEFKVTRRNLPHWQQPGSIYFIYLALQGGTIPCTGREDDCSGRDPLLGWAEITRVRGRGHARPCPCAGATSGKTRWNNL